jgi:hypothetical protein
MTPPVVHRTAAGLHRSTANHGQQPSGRDGGDQQEYIDDKPLAQFWAQVAQEQRTKVGTALRAVRQEMLDDQRPCAFLPAYCALLIPHHVMLMHPFQYARDLACC